MKSSELGKIGEDIACNYLESEGYGILGRNIKIGKDELDIVCRETITKTLCLVEVKCLSANNVFKPEDHFSRAKRQKFERVSRMFSAKHSDLLKESGMRLDLLAIEVKDPLLTDWRKDCAIRHYKNV